VIAKKSILQAEYSRFQFVMQFLKSVLSDYRTICGESGFSATTTRQLKSETFRQQSAVERILRSM